MVPYPLSCRPLFKEKVWGGRRLRELLGKDLPPDAPVGESWEVADLPEGSSTINNGPLSGRSLTEAVGEHREMILGSSAARIRFPLLVKFIDAHDDLSVQVHPDAETCRAHFPSERGKDETWIVVHAEPGARLMCGLRDGVDASQLQTQVETGEVIGCLNTIEPLPGDVLRIPPGTVHALGSGIVVLEIQEPSDTTFRLFDYHRPGMDGAPRALNLRESLLSIRHHSVSPIGPIVDTNEWGKTEYLIASPAYRIERWHVQAPMTLENALDTPKVAVLLGGELTMRSGEYSLAMRPGSSVIFPASLERVTIEPALPCCLIIAEPGEGA
ncbi:MAG: hypothetical protein AUJ92_00180 [Armatimonadetes bacterium CG2_30_59_28]|nr:MAG: hypothetical protein AUJ92_00180 [Armatimonadetes bacterium CG2_30_59_28]PIU66678.1 MAG: mannose-6-phosphate isomerase [Armatimonadetes bacterium CG07_land_8_20_14_0_80_59_28]PIX43839.1 MAG: mannose-6-phosphate isomerase [Armatimonadetes bacterium CG_4_8_14_3_um_filter_58_9]PJB68881.1 MAG: mannose-6-phosphate isomerase [Armatimonadetes bacterium CG_4_9_14_3_um_filter_58_7]